VSRRLLLASIGIVALGGCPKKNPQPEEPPVPIEVRPTLVRSWSELTPDLYPEFMELSEWEMRPTLGQLVARHDTDLWTRHESVWGPPDVPVVEFIDTDRPTTDTSSIAAWLLAPEVEETTGTLLPTRRRGYASSRSVIAVVLRDFVGAPTAEAPEDLAVGMGDAFPPPWTVCSPSTAPDTAIVFDSERGLKIGLSSDTSKAEGVWTVDHVEFLSPGFVAEEWWAAKGYGECVGFAAVDAQGRVRKLRKPR
jgi:hypothetical protein